MTIESKDIDFAVHSSLNCGGRIEVIVRLDYDINISNDAGAVYILRYMF